MYNIFRNCLMTQQKNPIPKFCWVMTHETISKNIYTYIHLYMTHDQVSEKSCFLHDLYDMHDYPF